MEGRPGFVATRENNGTQREARGTLSQVCIVHSLGEEKLSSIPAFSAMTEIALHSRVYWGQLNIMFVDMTT